MEKYVTVKKAAEMLGLSRQVIYRLAKEGKLTITKVHPLYGKHGPAHIPLAEVEALAAQLPPKP